jgi:hypothetical protein
MFHRSFHPSTTRWIGATGALWLLAAGACQTRERFLIPPTGDGIGPETVVDRPGEDTTVTSGPDFVATGYTRDQDGVDTLYFLTEGGASDRTVLFTSGDSVRWALPITTAGLVGHLITLRVFGTDRFGSRGDTVTRLLLVQ